MKASRWGWLVVRQLESKVEIQPEVESFEPGRLSQHLNLGASFFLVKKKVRLPGLPKGPSLPRGYRRALAVFLSAILIMLTQIQDAFAVDGAGKIEKSISDVQYLKYVVCKASGTLRTIRVEKRERGCVTKYQKDGVEKNVAAAASEAVCLDVVGKIQKNLEENKWACSDISSSRTSSLE